MTKIGIVGLGYVGLPLAIEFGKVFEVIAYDIDQTRIEELGRGYDHTHEVKFEEFAIATQLTFSCNEEDLKKVNYFIITVPTPIDKFKQPDLRALRKATKMVGTILKKGDIIIYESTVYPGCIEEICVPILERKSSLLFNQDFYCGYSPERINPGDKLHRITSIKKIISGSTPHVTDKIEKLYQRIITAGTYRAPSIQVAEASKVIENIQRDLNIALVNELSIIFQKLDIDIYEVLKAASTKWNFIPFKPGLVGGHCVGVDSFYLTYKSESIGYRPEIILSGRRINDNMPIHIANTVVKLMSRNNLSINKSNILILGITFKENCPDIRNSKVVDMIRELESYGALPETYDPHADADNVNRQYGISLIHSLKKSYHVIILAVAHEKFKYLNWNLIRKQETIVYDVKGFLDLSKDTQKV